MASDALGMIVGQHPAFPSTKPWHQGYLEAVAQRLDYFSRESAIAVPATNWSSARYVVSG